VSYSDYESNAGRGLQPVVNVGEAERWISAGAAAALLIYGLTRRSRAGALFALAGAPLAYRGVSGHCPVYSGLGVTTAGQTGDTREALSGDRGINVRDAVRLETPLEDVFQFWRRLENLPKFMAHLERVTETDAGRSRWVARGPAGIRLEWDAEIINEVENQVIGWRSLADADLVSAGSVNFDRVRGGRSTQVTVHLQYAPPAGRVGAAVATLFGRAPARTIREDLRRLKHLLEAGELAQSAASSAASR
jgi:uncharacterized membrane protein